MYIPDKSMSFDEALKHCKDQITNSDGYLIMEFKGIRITVSKDSNRDDLATIFVLKEKLMNIHKLTT